MAGASAAQTLAAAASGTPAPPTPPFVRRIIVATTVAFLTLFIVMPVVNVFAQALSKGVDAYVRVLHVARPAKAPAKPGRASQTRDGARSG